MFETSTTQPPRRRSVGIRVLILALLALAFVIPLSIVRSIVEERQGLRDGALADIRQSWGGPQTLAGPVLIAVRSCSRSAGEAAAWSTSQSVVLLPKHYSIDGAVEAETLKRGLHETAVLRAAITVEGDFPPLQGAFPLIACDSARLERATIVLALTEARGLDEIGDLEWNGAALPWESGSVDGPWNPGMHVDLPLERVEAAAAQGGSFRLHLKVRASERLSFLPLGSPTRVQLTSKWPTPSFRGAFLPKTRTLTGEGFRATWDIPALARSLPPSWQGAPPSSAAPAESQFGAEWLIPADGYLRTERALKYGLMFVGATFACLYFFELFGRRALHPMHYLLVGAALIVFYLLLLSLSEQLGFTIAYGLATGATTVLVSGYAVSILGGWLRGASLGAALAGFYAALFFLLRAEEHALLVGSIGLFAALAVVMWLTRRIDWSNPRLGHAPVQAAEQP